MAISSPITINADASFGGSTEAATLVGGSAPSVVAQGVEWFDSESGRTFIWYIDADGGQWVEA